ncbi:hypothetical protein [Nocardia barduliensis]|uniref:hypothetical protein n=1 Tax=Nocardia barduliensis TaxID=2736643 RepID=UPI001FE7AA5C|nr:hypothetical protein [Nocardia barduliensis]
MDMKLEVAVVPVADVDRAKARRSCGSFAAFTDPDGNGWFLREITQRAPGR